MPAERIISIDCEANGLHGQVFAAAATLQHWRYGQIGAWGHRCPIGGTVDPWVAEHVLPGLDDELHGMQTTVDSYNDLCQEWRDFYDPLKKEGDWQVVCHVPWPVEARFLWDAHRDEPFSGPFPILDVAGMLDAAGNDPTSVDDYLRKLGLKPAGRAHHPLDDAINAATAYWYLSGRWRR